MRLASKAASRLVQCAQTTITSFGGNGSNDTLIRDSNANVPSLPAINRHRLIFRSCRGLLSSHRSSIASSMAYPQLLRVNSLSGYVSAISVRVSSSSAHRINCAYILSSNPLTLSFPNSLTPSSQNAHPKRASNSPIVYSAKCTLLPSARIPSASNTCGRVLPYINECVPHELLPTIPPMQHLFDVDVSGLKKSPYGLQAIFNSSRTTPGSTHAYRSSALISRIRFIYRLTSATIPLPTT